MPGSLFIVASPLGNLKDITQRALDALREAEIVAAEDTRVTKKLLAHYGIRMPYMLSYANHNERASAAKILELLKEGKKIALITNAGTPTISDPGYSIVNMIIEHNDNCKDKVEMISLPGPSTPVIALSVSGLAVDRFTFEGFLPNKEQQKKGLLLQLVNEPRTMIFFDAPTRVLESMRILSELLPKRKLVLCRELTKMHEEILRGTTADVFEQLKKRGNAKSMKGEFTLLLEGSRNQEEEPSISVDDMDLEVEAYFRYHAMGIKDFSKFLAKKYKKNSKDCYNYLMKNFMNQKKNDGPE